MLLDRISRAPCKRGFWRAVGQPFGKLLGDQKGETAIGNSPARDIESAIEARSRVRLEAAESKREKEREEAVLILENHLFRLSRVTGGSTFDRLESLPCHVDSLMHFTRG